MKRPLVPTIAVQIPDPCALTFKTPSPDQAFAASLARLKSAANAQIFDLSYEAGRSYGSAKATLAGVNLLATNIRSTLEAAGTALAATAKPDVQTAIAKALVSQLTSSATSIATQTINTAVASALNGITNMAIGEMQRNLAPVYDKLGQLSAVIGQAAMSVQLANSVFASRGCAANSEILAEVFFRRKK
jgi:hypothetical protein